MILFSQDSHIEYGFTPSGQFHETFRNSKTGKLEFSRVTTDVQQFLGWMIREEIISYKEKRVRAALVLFMKKFWTCRLTPDDLRGSFNEDLYNKIIERSKKDGTI
jgi:hypothetical protein